MRIFSARAVANRSKKAKAIETKAQVLTTSIVTIPKLKSRSLARKLFKGGKTGAAEEASSTGWILYGLDGEAPAAVVIYSDAHGVMHKTLDDDIVCGTHQPSGGISENMKGVERASHDRITRAAARLEHRHRRVGKLSALWDSKRGANYVRKMHNIQQAQPRAISH